MKKFSAILLICIYALSITGVAVNKFYCCGQLKSISIAATSSSFADCKVPVKKKGCCDKSSQTFKIKDQHFASDTSPLAALASSAILAPYNLFDLVLPVSLKDEVAFNYHAPPFLSGIPIRTLNCTYQI